MQDLRAEVRQLHRLFVGHLRQHERRRHDPRIRAQDAVDVRPDLDDGGADGGADDRGAVIGAVAADGRRLPVFGGADEPGHDRDDPARAPKQAGEVRAGPAVRLPEDDAGVGELVVGDDQVARVDERGRPRLAEIGGDDDRGQALAEARGHVERAERTMAQEVDTLERAAKLGEQRIDLRKDGPGT